MSPAGVSGRYAARAPAFRPEADPATLGDHCAMQVVGDEPIHHRERRQGAAGGKGFEGAEPLASPMCSDRASSSSSGPPPSPSSRAARMVHAWVVGRRVRVRCDAGKRQYTA